jgi:effector-binding domain-containing protein
MNNVYQCISCWATPKIDDTPTYQHRLPRPAPQTVRQTVRENMKKLGRSGAVPLGVTYRLEGLQVTDSPQQLVAKIPLVVEHGQMPSVIGPGISEVFSVISAQSISVVGPWFAHHYKITETHFDFAICVPVSSPVAASGRVIPGVRDATQVARAVLCGPYEHLSDGWSELMAWVEAEGLQPRSDLWEIYTAGPESGDDSSDWRTELNRPLLG